MDILNNSENTSHPHPFSKSPTAYPLFYRSYSRKIHDSDLNERESWEDVTSRTIGGLAKLANLTQEEIDLLTEMQLSLKTIVSGRWLWVGGTDWVEKPENFYGAYNCSSTRIVDWESFGLLMNLAMMGCGTGAVLYHRYISQLPSIINYLDVSIDERNPIGSVSKEKRKEDTIISFSENKETPTVFIIVGDSRKGWVDGYVKLLELSSNLHISSSKKIKVIVDLSNVRPSGERLNGFGGVANPIKLADLFINVAKVLNKAIGRQLNSVECSLIIDHAAISVVSGNIRRCIAYGEKVNTKSGLKPIQDIEVGDLVLTSSGRYMPVVNKFIQGVQKTVKIETASTSIRCTPNHKVAVYDGLDSYKWKMAGELSQGKDAMIFFPNWEYLTSDYLPDMTKFDWVPQPVSQVIPSEEVETFDIEVEEDHEFVCEGLLVSNSAGMRQADSSDSLFSTAKDNLWQQDKDGNWSIDPERDALRMANHTRVFHTKPTREDCIESVRKQFYSGEGAIQWGGEAIARANIDLIKTEEDKKEFLSIYNSDKTQLIHWLKNKKPDIGLDEIEHRLARNGLNPCVTADTWVHTEDGPRQVKDLIGKQHGVWINGELFNTTEEGFFYSGSKPVVKLVTEEGYTLRLTKNHRLLKVINQSQENQYSDWVEVENLQIGDRILLHNHRGTTPRSGHWSGNGTGGEGWSLGLLETAVNVSIEKSSFEFYQGFLRGIFCCKGSAIEDQAEESSISLVLNDSENNLEELQAIQRMLARLGIISAICQDKLVITKDNLLRFDVVGFADPEKREKLESIVSNHKKDISKESFTATIASIELDGIEDVYDCTVPGPNCFDANGLVAHNCGEIIGADFKCNLSEVHLNLINPLDYAEQEKAFRAATISVCSLLHHQFVDERYAKSRDFDPIVGVSFTGLFDFFVNLFGVDWLRWWDAGRPSSLEGVDVDYFIGTEREYLAKWKNTVKETLEEFCDRHNLKKPNRFTTVQPGGSKSLLTGASAGWHPPKSQRFIRRITFAKNDPVALACIDYGYSVIPSQSDKDETGRLLDDPYDVRCTEWLVEIPVEVNWANIPGADQIDISKFSVKAQFDFYMQIQKYYVGHNASATLELRESEIEELGDLIYNAIDQDEGYISVALLARFDSLETFPRLPFEPINKEKFDSLSQDVLRRRKTNDFHKALSKYDIGEQTEAGPAGCDSDKCLMPLKESLLKESPLK